MDDSPQDQARSFRGVLHYLAGDKEKLLSDFEKSLPLLWERFNRRFDYPVVIFHDGMSLERGPGFHGDGPPPLCQACSGEVIAS